MRDVKAVSKGQFKLIYDWMQQNMFGVRNDESAGPVDPSQG